MKLLHSKVTYEISMDDLKALVAAKLNVEVNKVHLNPQYGWPEYDGPGNSYREVTGFEVVVTA